MALSPNPNVQFGQQRLRHEIGLFSYSPDHAGELIIELPVGSYVPAFREPAPPQTSFGIEPSVTEKVETLPTDAVASSLLEANTEQAHSRHVSLRWLLLAIALVVAALIGFSVGRAILGSHAAGVVSL